MKEFISMLSCSELLGSSISEPALTTILNQFDRTELFFYFSKIQLILVNDDWQRNTQLMNLLANELLPPKAKKQYFRIQSQHKKANERAEELSVRPFVSPMHCMHILKRIILQHTNDHGKLIQTQDHVYDLGIAILGSSEYVLRPNTTGLCAVAQELIRYGTFIARHKQEATSLGRSFKLYLNYGRMSEFAISGQSIDEIFFEVTGVKLENYLALGIGIVSHFQNVTIDSLVQSDELQRRLMSSICWEKLFEVSKIPSTELNLAKGLFSKSVNDLRNQLLCGAGINHFDHDIVPFIESPLIQIDSNCLVPAYLPFIWERIALGPFWILSNHLQSSNETKSGEFKNKWGKIFERYVTDFFIKNMIVGLNATKDIIFDKPYESKHGRRKSTDIICYVEQQECLYMFEITASIVNRGSWSKENNLEEFDRVNKRILEEKAQSISRNLRDFQSGHIAPDQFKRWKISRVRSFVIMLDSYPQHPILWHGILETLRGTKEYCKINHSLENVNVAPMKIIDVEDFERLGYLHKHGVPWWNLLEEWEVVTPEEDGYPLNRLFGERYKERIHQSSLVNEYSEIMRLSLDILLPNCTEEQKLEFDLSLQKPN